LAQPGIAAGAGIIADGIKSGSLRQRGIPRLPLGGRRNPGDRIARAAIDLNAPAAGRNVLADLVVVPKFRVFGRSVLVADPKARTFGRSVLAGPVVVPKLRTFGRSVLVADPRAQTFGRGVLVVHNDPATPLAPAAGIITSLVRVRIIRRDNNPAMQLARVEGIGSILARARISRRDNNRSTRRGLGRPRRRAPEHSPPRDKETRASAIALREADDLARSENARCETFVSGTLLEPLVAHVRLHYFRHSRSVRGHWSRIIPGRLTSQK
jgi:hypothetical protein